MQGKTVLMFAIEAKMEALIYKLIEMGADIHAKTVCPTPLLPSHLPCEISDLFLACFGAPNAIVNRRYVSPHPLKTCSVTRNAF